MIKFEEGVNEIQHMQGSLIEITKKKSKDKVWSKVISWIEKRHLLEKSETRVKAREVLVEYSMLNPEVLKMKDGVLMFTKAANKYWIGEVWQICLPESMVKEA